MKEKKNNIISIIVLLILTILLSLLVLYAFSKKYLNTKENEKLTNAERVNYSIIANTNMDNLDTRYIVLNALDKTTDIDLKLYNNHVFELIAIKYGEVIERTRGVYSIKGNKLTITRVLSALENEYGLAWSAESINPYIPITESFTFEGENNEQINMQNYFLNTDKEPLTIHKDTINEYVNEEVEENSTEPNE